MPPKSNFVKIATVFDPAEAEVLRGLLEAQGIRVLVSKEAAAQVYGTFVGSMSEIELYVAAEDEAAAQGVVEGFFSGQ